VYDLYSKEVGCANSAVVVSDRKELEIRTAPKVIIPIIKYHDPKTVADQLYGE
jgi:hypothetical protein